MSLLGEEVPDDTRRTALLAARAEATARIVALAVDLDGIIEATAGANSDDEHDPEGATIAFERAQVVALLEQGRERVCDIDVALSRIDDGTYGTCAGCGAPIGPGRLEARPSATTCITCASPARRR